MHICVTIVVRHLFMDVFLYIHVINTNLEFYLKWYLHSDFECNGFKFTRQNLDS